MTVLFLDIDGVLNSVRYDRERRAGQGNIDETRLPLLQKIQTETHAQIVLSSSWRTHWEKTAEECDGIGLELRELFARYGLSVSDKTPELPSRNRAEEIRCWLRTHETPDAFAILDDEAFGWGEDLGPHLVRTDCRIGRGLEETHVRKVISLLTGTGENG